MTLQRSVNSPDSSTVSCHREKWSKTLHGIFTAEIIINNSIFVFPGHGEAGEFCGEPVHAVSCPNFDQPVLGGKAHDRFVVLRSCRKASCPVCYEAWAVREGNRASERIIKALGLYKKAGVDLGRVNHIVFSPPQERAIELIKTLEGYKTLRSEAVKLFKAAGVRGGAMEIHPFRQNDPREKNFNVDMPKYVWYLSPHFHVEGVGFLEKSDIFYKKTGWVYHNIGRRETIAGTIIYALEHCGIHPDLHSLTWFGVFSYDKILIDQKLKVEDPIPCSVCGEDLHEYGLVVNHDIERVEADWSHDLDIFYRRAVKITYKLKGYDPPKVAEDSQLFQRRLL